MNESKCAPAFSLTHKNKKMSSLSLFQQFARKLVDDCHHNKYWTIVASTESPATLLLQHKAIMSTSMQSTPGKHLQTTGDIVVAIKSCDGSSDKGILNYHTRRYGSSSSRITDKEFHFSNKKAYQHIRDTTISYIKT